MNKGVSQMKRISPVVVVVVIFATGASSHKSGWMESFDAFGEGYSYGKDVLPAPWEGAVSMIAGAELATIRPPPTARQ